MPRARASVDPASRRIVAGRLRSTSPLGRSRAERFRPEAHGRDRRGGLDERLGVGVLRVVQDLLGRPLLHDAAAVTSRRRASARSAASPRSCVMSSTDVPSSSVIRSSWSRIVRCTVTSRALVGSSAISRRGLAGQPDRDQGPLAHAAGELVGVLLRPRSGVRAGRPPERLDDLVVDVLARSEAVREQGLGDLRADLRHGIEVRHRVLRDEPDLATADRPHVGLRCADELPAVERDAAARDAPAAGEQPDDGHRGGRLARAGLADDGDASRPRRSRGRRPPRRARCHRWSRSRRRDPAPTAVSSGRAPRPCRSESCTPSCPARATGASRRGQPLPTRNGCPGAG